MPRIISGTLRGRNIAVPAGGTRPTSDRVREALFSRLDHLGWLDDVTVLDLFAGAGCLGLEALSRGATHATFVDAATAATNAIRSTVATFGCGPQTTIITAKAETYVAGARGPFDLVFLDPPYEIDDAVLTAVLEGLAGGDGGAGPLADHACIVVERSKRQNPPALPAGWEEVFDRTWGDTRIWCAVVDRSLEPTS